MYWIAPLILWFIFFVPVQTNNNHNVLTRGYFRPPLDGRLALSGSFGEIRTGHFHSGLDFRTGGVEGRKIFASAAGNIVRVRVSPVGFGKALYIEHENGFTTVYAHLRDFIPEIRQYVINEQYRRKSFEVDLYPETGLFRVMKGDLIGWSGNSGSSGGPHLHFEIRQTDGQIPLNPINFGIPVKDEVAPVFQSLMIYPEDDFSSINNIPQPQRFTVAQQGKHYSLSLKHPIVVSGKVSFGVRAYDLHNNNNLRNGINTVKVFADDRLLFHYHIEKFSFANARFVNAVIDYEELVRNNRRYIRTRKLESNPLNIYPTTENNGIIDFSTLGTSTIRIVVGDSHANQSLLTFAVAGKPASEAPLHVRDIAGKRWFNHKKANRFEKDGLKIALPEGSLYEDLWFQTTSTPGETKSLSKVYQIGNRFVPVHRPYRLSISASGIAERLLSKTLIARRTDQGWEAEGGVAENGWIVANVREFGEFTLMTDTIPPIIKPLNLQNRMRVELADTLRFSINDEFSGIGNYEGTLNG
ncbi:MAG TPA: M23 family metallopeptidase, partial [Bacteroidales bacterium]|nr:M23 family metallopeptidase [Bacteroidales bacterium]